MMEKERKILEELAMWLAREETLWRQRSRILWMNHGDKNTKFFHARASQRRKRNMIDKLQDNQGIIHEEQSKILGIVTSYFNNMFQSSISGSNRGIDAQIGCIGQVVSEEMNSWLLRYISEEEIRAAIFSMGPLQAPRVDGFPAIFYQKHWDSIKDNVIKEVKDFWEEGLLDNEINKTLIVLIPKKKEAVRMEDWRPISLCTVAMKIITKTISHRLQPFLIQIVSPFQSAFVKGRVITDNIVVAHEVANFFKNCKEGGSYYASVKIDMSKAYDRVEWPFLENVLLKMGFAARWVERVMQCVRSVSYQIRVNGNVSEAILPRRGLRQGDPLSPYLFLFCTELLNAMLVKSVESGLISGIKVCRKAPVVSHLFFADDAIFFIKAECREANNLKGNTPVDFRLDICEALRVPQVRSHSRYLGIPLLIGQRKSETFREIVEKIWRRVKDWKSNLLSAGGREILIKAILQAIPTHMMSVYYFPRRIISELHKLMLQFWWDKKEGNRGISWIRQGILQQKKSVGGLGFKYLAVFNEAMLLKIAWRMVKFPSILMSRLLLAKYCKGETIFDASLGGRPSHLWRGVMKSIKFLLEGLWFDDRLPTYRWKYSTSGDYTVKSGYEVIKAHEDCSKQGIGEQSDKNALVKFWKKIWSAAIPNKVKIFCWRLYYNSLPDAFNLRKRGIDLNTECRICGFSRETGLHLVKDCWWSRALFSSLKLHIPELEAEPENPADWIWWCSRNLKKEEFNKYLIAIWLCWRNRNNIWHEKEEDCHAEEWRPPAEGEIKINIDGSWEASMKEAGLGIVARDHQGTFLWCWAVHWKEATCSSEVEGQALLLGMRLASSMDIKVAIFETDSLKVFRVVYSRTGAAEWCDSWLEDVVEFIRSRPSWKVKLINREANGAADWLASRARSQAWRWNRVDAVPLFSISNM
ncbi:hypothetical protein QQ045_017337 [Rhodiola kirilowii]